MKNSIFKILSMLALIQFIGVSAHALSCKSIVGTNPLTINVIAKRIKQGVALADGDLQSFMADGALEGYYAAVAIGVKPEKARALVFEASRVRLHSPSIQGSEKAYYAAVAAGVTPSEASERIQAARGLQPPKHGKHGKVEGYYIAVAFGVAPMDAAKAVNAQSSFPNIESYTNLLAGFYAGLAFGVDQKTLNENIGLAFRTHEQIPGFLKKGVLSGFYFAAALKSELDE